MPARLVLAVCAALVLVWVGVLVRDHYVGQAGAERLLYDSNLSASEFERSIDQLEDSRFLNPGTTAELARGQYYLFHGQPRAAARAAEQLVRSEPDNADAWRLLWQATRETDPARAREAAAALKRLNPLASL
jgi:predicted Zn-dependent protease